MEREYNGQERLRKWEEPVQQSSKTLARNWPADFDQAGRIRATSVPLGHAYKTFVKAGEKDINGKVVTEEGY